jgi:DNA polymerase family B
MVDAINAAIAPPTKIEFEKVFGVFMQLCKKRYAGLMHVDDKALPVVSYKGVQCVQKGGVSLVSDLVRDVLENIVHTAKPDEAASMVRRYSLWLPAAAPRLRHTDAPLWVAGSSRTSTRTASRSISTPSHRCCARARSSTASPSRRSRCRRRGPRSSPAARSRSSLTRSSTRYLQLYHR